MRTKVDYGIDLGTTNSAIARMENGIPIIKKTDTLKDTLPSCVHFNRKQDTLVGDAAVNVMKNDNARALRTFVKGTSNSFTEFKRTMGTTHVYESTNMNKSYTSEELSAEVLKKLKSLILDENISSIVITVPTKFLSPQKEATKRAAQLAGFKHVELLQEPVAAATAYGLTAKDKDSYWLVFDFGGGTFDAALLKSEEGILAVKDTDGDNWLGGKNLDEAIVDRIIIPYLQENYAIEDLLFSARKKEMLRNAVKPFAEEAKIQLSFKESYNILSNLGDLPFEDENGEEPEIDVVITQNDMERVLSPIFQKAINITKDLLTRNHLTGSDLGALILVGGPTHSPILRRMLKEQITKNVDESADPMTVVAKGAALFASTIAVPEEVKESARDKSKLQLELKYESTTVELDELVSIKVVKEITTGVFPDQIYAEITRTDGFWSSGKRLINERATLFDVVLLENRSNAFRVHLYDEQGNKLDCQPNAFSILQGIGGLESMSVLPYYIGIGKWFDAEEKDLFIPIKGLEKNKTIPAKGVIKGLKTRKEIRPGVASDIIRIPIYQGDYYAEGTNPVLNNWVTEVIISGEKMPKLLPAGSDVDITIKVDRSEQMQFSAFFPLINYVEELKIQIKQVEPPTEEQLSYNITQAKRVAAEVKALDVLEALEALDVQLVNERGSADGKMKILDGLRKELLKLDKAEKSIQYTKITDELRKSFHDLEELINGIKRNGGDLKLNMDKVDEYINECKLKIELFIKNRNQKEAKELIQEIGTIEFNIRNTISDNAMDIQFLRVFNESFEKFHWKDENKAQQLIDQAMQLVVSGNTYIRPLLIEIINLLPEEEKEKLPFTGTLE